MKYVAKVQNQLKVICETACRNLDICSTNVKIQNDLAATENKYNVGVMFDYTT